MLFKKNPSVFWKMDSMVITPFSPSSPLQLNSKCTKKEFCLFYVHPVFNLDGTNVTIIGEMSKFVPVSPQRFRSIQLSTNSINIQVYGAITEEIEFTFTLNQRFNTIKCTFDALKLRTIQITTTSAFCF